MKKLTKFEKFGLAAALIIACTFYYMKYMYDPQAKVLAKTVKKLNKVIGEYNELKDVPSVESVNRTIKKRRKRLAALKSSLESSAVKTGKDSEITDLLSRINRLIEENRLVVKSIAPRSDKISGAFFAWNAYDLDISGSFYRFIDFLSALREMPDAVKVEHIQIEKGENGNSGLNIKLLLMI